MLCFFSCQQASRAQVGARCCQGALGLGPTSSPLPLTPGWVDSHSLKAQLGATWGCQLVLPLMAPESSPVLPTTTLSTPTVQATPRADGGARLLDPSSAAAGDRVGRRERGTARPTANPIMLVILTRALCARRCLSARPESPPWNPLKALCGQDVSLLFFQMGKVRHREGK